MLKALIVEDDLHSLEALAEWVTEQGFEVVTASSVDHARRRISEALFDLAILDLQLPDGSGMEVVRELEQQPRAEVVMITAHGSIDSAVEAMRGGVIDYLTKPVDLNRLRNLLTKVKRTLEMRDEIEELRGELIRLGHFGHMIGNSAAIRKTYNLIERVAPTNSTVFIVGETGTGKDLVAQRVHELSHRAKAPFLPVNCGAVPHNLFESELFGHEKGSFTGAEKQRKGIFARADGGTLFLDEVTEMPPALQVKLLRVLEAGMVTRVGGDRAERVDVRIVAATNHDPESAVSDGKLREDLLYRLNVFPIPVPPLRERNGDVELLATHFLDELNRQAGTAKRFGDRTLELLRRLPWPGNVRELRNVVERAYILAPDSIEPAFLPIEGIAPGRAETEANAVVGHSIAAMEQKLILATLEQVGDKKQAAEILGISLKTLYNRLKLYGA